jgi:CheY-like chemotaxis protein
MTQGRILIVEDEVMLAKELARGLKKSGNEVVGRVSTGEEAIQRAEETLPDLILMDINLEGAMDGIEVSSRIQSSIDTAIIYLTAHTAPDVFERAKITEPYAYLTKPISPQELGRTVEMALYKRQMDRRLKEGEARVRLNNSVLCSPWHGNRITRILGLRISWTKTTTKPYTLVSRRSLAFLELVGMEICSMSRDMKPTISLSCSMMRSLRMRFAT